MARSLQSGQPVRVTDAFGGAPTEQRFWAEVMILAAPVFFSVWGAFAVFALTHGRRQAGTFLGIVWLLGAAGTLRQPYVAILRPDASLTFKALTRRITTTVDAVYRVSISGGRAPTYFTSMIARPRLECSGGGPCLATSSSGIPQSSIARRSCSKTALRERHVCRSALDLLNRIWQSGRCAQR
jgi:hypothetical protein